MTWSEQAEALLPGITETGTTAAGIVAAAWRAGVDVDATMGLTLAALEMYATPKDLLSGGLVPLPSDHVMLAQAADVATDTGNHATQVRALADQVVNALDVAVLAATAAAERARTASNPAEAFPARQDERQAQATIADCEYALEILVDMAGRLARAIDCLAHLPDELLTAYERPYEHRRAGGTLPYHGDFLTGVQA